MDEERRRDASFSYGQGCQMLKHVADVAEEGPAESWARDCRSGFAVLPLERVGVEHLVAEAVVERSFGGVTKGWVRTDVDCGLTQQVNGRTVPTSFRRDAPTFESASYVWAHDRRSGTPVTTLPRVERCSPNRAV
jgi:hypothetical protein